METTFGAHKTLFLFLHFSTYILHYLLYKPYMLCFQYRILCISSYHILCSQYLHFLPVVNKLSNFLDSTLKARELYSDLLDK